MMKSALRHGVPAPTVELTLGALFLRAHLKTLSPKKRRVFLRELATAMTDFNEHANIVRLRGREHDDAVARTRQEAAAWLQATLAAFTIADGERL